MNRQLRSELLRILDCYYEDMRYHATITDVSGINAVTNGTPSFDSKEELQAYLEEVHNTIGEFIEETRDEIADAVEEKVLNMRVEDLRAMVFQELMSFYSKDATQEDVKNLMKEVNDE